MRTFVSTPSATGSRNGAGFMPCQGLFYVPGDSAVETAFIATHYNVDFSEHYLGDYLAARGFGFLGWNTRFRGAEAFFLLEHALIDIAEGVRWLRETAKVKNIVLLGNSGGGSLMAAYQSQAVDPNITAVAGMSLPDAVMHLPAADFYVSLNAHGGRPDVLTAWMDPSITDETDPTSIDPDLNMYDPANPAPYSEAFLTRYRNAQVERNRRITAWVHEELKRLAHLGYTDRAFNLYRTWADPRLMDPSIDPSQRPPGVCYAGDPRKANFSPRGIGLTNTLRTWLSMWSLDESSCRGTPHLQRIQIPALVIQSDADTGVFPSDAAAIYTALGSSDKSQVMIEGDHYLQQPSDARDSAADQITHWLNSRL
jgi:acetyl esterase/lipase